MLFIKINKVKNKIKTIFERETLSRTYRYLGNKPKKAGALHFVCAFRVLSGAHPAATATGAQLAAIYNLIRDFAIRDQFFFFFHSKHVNLPFDSINPIINLTKHDPCMHTS